MGNSNYTIHMIPIVVRIGNYGDLDKTNRKLVSYKPKGGISTTLWKSLTSEEKKSVRTSQMRYFQISQD